MQSATTQGEPRSTTGGGGVARPPPPFLSCRTRLSDTCQQSLGSSLFLVLSISCPSGPCLSCVQCQEDRVQPKEQNLKATKGGVSQGACGRIREPTVVQAAQSHSGGHPPTHGKVRVPHHLSAIVQAFVTPLTIRSSFSVLFWGRANDVWGVRRAKSPLCMWGAFIVWGGSSGDAGRLGCYLYQACIPSLP